MRTQSIRDRKKENAHDLVVYGCYTAAAIWCVACSYLIFVP